MPDNSDAKQGKDSIIMKINTLVLCLAGFLLPGAACNKKNRPEQIPTGPVNLTIDLNLPSNQKLIPVGTYGYYEGGVKGVLVVHDFDDEWYAFERTCAWEPLNSCSKVWGDSINLNIRCGTYNGNTFTTCCQSLFSYNGYPTKGPAIGRLAQYRIQKSGNLLMVYN